MDGFVFWRASVLECGSPLPLLRRQSCRGKSGRGLPHSKTSRNFSGALEKHGHSIIENDPTRRLAHQTFVSESFRRRSNCSRVTGETDRRDCFARTISLRVLSALICARVT